MSSSQSMMKLCNIKVSASFKKPFYEKQKINKKITRRTIGAKGFNFLQERLDKKGLKGTTSLYLSITIYSLSSIIYCYYLSSPSNMCFWGVGLKKCII